MTQMRLWLVTLLVWMSVLFNLERLHEPINIASFVYVFDGLLAVLVIAIRPMKRAALSWLLAGSFAVLIALKFLLGYQIMRASLPLTVTEAVSMVTTMAIAHQIARQLWRFEEGAVDLATARWHTRSRSFEHGQTEMYRELRRARRFDRPLSLVVLEPTSQGLNISANRLLEEVRLEMIQRYVEVRLADSLEAEFSDCDLVANHDGRFVAMLPEMEREQTETMMRQIVRRVEQELGLELRIGMATFPDEELTLAGLVSRAESEMTRQPGEEALPEPAATSESQLRRDLVGNDL